MNIYENPITNKKEEVCGLGFTIYSYQLPNNAGRPCEDGNPTYWFNNQHDLLVIVIADGITRSPSEGVYPNPSPAKLAADTAVVSASQFLSQALGAGNNPYQDNPEELLREAIISANQQVGELNQRLDLTPLNVDYQARDYAGTTLTLAMVSTEKQQVSWAYIGDSPILVIGDIDKNPLVNPPQTARKDFFREKLQEKLGLMDREAWRQWYRSQLRNKPYHYYGQQIGFGALTGEPQAADFIQTGSRSLPAKASILVATDGILSIHPEQIADIIKRYVEKNRPELALPSVSAQALSVNKGKNKPFDDITAVLACHSN